MRQHPTQGVEAVSSEGEGIRRKYLYRRLIVTGRVRAPLQAAIRLVGPDCAYHLYSSHDGKRQRVRS